MLIPLTSFALNPSAATVAGITSAVGSQQLPGEPEESEPQQAPSQPFMWCQAPQGPACNNSASDFWACPKLPFCCHMSLSPGRALWAEQSWSCAEPGTSTGQGRTLQSPWQQLRGTQGTQTQGTQTQGTQTSSAHAGAVRSLRPPALTWQEAEGKKGFAAKCFVSLASKIGGEVSTQEPTELGCDAEQPGSTSSSVLEQAVPCTGLGWHWGSEQC